jgi:hypothetical protein
MPASKMPSKEQRQAMCDEVYKLHLGVYRHLNDVYIFTQQAMPLLDVGRTFNSGSKFKGLDRRYYVPGKNNTSFARRTDAELQDIFRSFLDRELYASLLATVVATTESFLFDVLEHVLRLYPQKLTLTPQGNQVGRDIPISLLFESNDLSAVISSVIQTRLHNLAYASPRQYLAYFKEITGVKTDELAFSYLVEIKATRDLVVHNRGVINAIYLQKAESHARGKSGELAEIDEKYFKHAIAQLKRVSGIVSRDIKACFSLAPKGT